jgi:hypothetical protein
MTKRVRGIYFNTEDNICSFILEESEEVTPGNDDDFSGIKISDLAVALFVYCNEDVKSKNISFSLEPLDERHPEGDYQKKVLWPDETEGRTIISGTDFSEIMFETDWIMK